MTAQDELFTPVNTAALKADREHVERMAWAVQLGAACVQRVAWIEDMGPHGPTMDQAVEAVAHPLTGVTLNEMRLLVAALAARVAGLQTGVDRSAVLAVQAVRQALADFDASRRSEAAA